MGVRRKAKDSERLLGKTKKRKIKENAALGKSVDAHKSISEIEKRPSTQKGKDVERLLFKDKKRKKKMNRASDESAEVFESPCDIEKGCKIQKGMDVEWLSVKTKKRKIKEHKTSDQSIGAGEPPEFEKGSKTLKAKDSERLLGKTKKRKIQENAALGKSIDAHKSISEIEKRPSTQKGKDAERLLFKNKKRKKKMNRASDESAEVFESPCDIEKGCKIQKGMDVEWLSVKTKKRKIKEHKTSDQSIGAGESPSEFEKGSKTLKGRRSEKIDSLESSIHSEALNETDSFIEPEVTANESKTRASEFFIFIITDMSSFTACLSSECLILFHLLVSGKFKKNCKHKKKQLTKVQEINIEEIQRVVDEEKVDEISLVGDDCTKGMKKWLIQYKESRPGLKVLQQRIDEFVTAHEERQEQERTEREARAAEDGWTVVVHQKGRKKTTDAETGTAMGSVASAAVMDMMSKKKSKEITLDFYRFQKREAKRNEVMMLQRKFEQDKKRIQQLRAARKFRPS